MASPRPREHPDRTPPAETTAKGPASSPPPASAIVRRARFEIACVGRTHRGHVRELNEDQFLIAELRTRLEVVDASFETLPPPTLNAGTLAVVADGMGGHPAGEQASALAVSAIKQIVSASLGGGALHQAGSEVLGALRRGFLHADELLARVCAAHPELAGMGTTLTVAMVRGAELFLAHAGDSRAYLLRDGRLMPLTKDHTVARALVEAGVVSEAQARAHKRAWSHVLTNVVGGSEGGASPELGRLTVHAGDRVLLCTDGLTRMVPSSEMATAMADRDTPLSVVADRLVEAALGRGGVDNVTVVLLDIVAK